MSLAIVAVVVEVVVVVMVMMVLEDRAVERGLVDVCEKYSTSLVFVHCTQLWYTTYLNLIGQHTVVCSPTLGRSCNSAYAWQQYWYKQALTSNPHFNSAHSCFNQYVNCAHDKSTDLHSLLMFISYRECRWYARAFIVGA